MATSWQRDFNRFGTPVPVEQSMKSELVINAGTGKTLGLGLGLGLGIDRIAMVLLRCMNLSGTNSALAGLPPKCLAILGGYPSL